MHFSILVWTLSLLSLSQARVVHYEKRANIDLGICGTPEIKFAFGLDGRTEAAFQAVNLTAFNHGSAQNIGVITGFITQQLGTACKAPAATVNLATQASTKANAATKGGAQADAWNAVFGITTDFATVGTSATTATPPEPAAAGPAVCQVGPPTTLTSTPAAVTTTGISFGKCTDPTMKSGFGLDGRKATEFSFIPNNQVQFPHGSALNPAIITQFICDTCDTFVNTCGANKAAQTLCAAAKAKADALGAAGQQSTSDTFNHALGF